MDVQLRDIRPEDKERLRRWRNSPDVAQYMFTGGCISEEEHDRWFSDIATDPTRRYWIILNSGQEVGSAHLYNIDQANRRCYWSFYVGEPALRMRGIGASVEYLVLRYVFDDLKLNKLCSEVLASNQSVVRLNRNFGFREEGIFRRHVFKDGKSVDVHCFGMLEKEWPEVKARIQKRLRGVV